jgi:predicted AlkP superfamily pyrophosphatase or phosphodiesterase
MTMLRLTLLLFIGLASAMARAQGDAPPLLVISLDGFRWDYCDLFPNESPTLRKLRRDGVTARGVVPVFPSNTFPNHYSIVTGLYPAHHGIVNNDFFDPTLGQFFRYNQPTARDPQWWQGEPIWLTATKQGRTAATSFWVGSDVQIGGGRPTFWRTYDATVPFEARLEELSSWLKLPAEKRPAVLLFYFDDTNAAGHRFGPDSPELIAAIKRADECVAALLQRMHTEGLEPNVMIVSDHGMTATSIERTIILDELLDLKSVQIDADGSSLAVRPLDGDVNALVRKFEKVAHVKAYRAEELRGRFHFAENARIAPVWVLPDEGWHLVTRATVERLKRRFPEKGYLAGDHGYDPALPSMRGIFIAHGPAFRRAVGLPDVENVHLYNLMCAVLKVKPAKNDGDDRLVKWALRE